MTPQELLRQLYLADPYQAHQFGRVLSHVSKAIADFEADPGLQRTDVFYINDPKDPHSRFGHDLVLRREPGAGIIVVRAQNGDALAIRCNLVGGRFEVERVVYSDAASTTPSLQSLVETIHGGNGAFRHWSAPDPGSFTTDWLTTY